MSFKKTVTFGQACTNIEQIIYDFRIYLLNSHKLFITDWDSFILDSASKIQKSLEFEKEFRDFEFKNYENYNKTLLCECPEQIIISLTNFKNKAKNL